MSKKNSIRYTLGYEAADKIILELRAKDEKETQWLGRYFSPGHGLEYKKGFRARTKEYQMENLLLKRGKQNGNNT